MHFYFFSPYLICNLRFLVICIVGVNSIVSLPFLNMKLYVEIGLLRRNICKKYQEEKVNILLDIIDEEEEGEKAKVVFLFFVLYVPKKRPSFHRRCWIEMVH